MIIIMYTTAILADRINKSKGGGDVACIDLIEKFNNADEHIYDEDKKEEAYAIIK